MELELLTTLLNRLNKVSPMHPQALLLESHLECPERCPTTLPCFMDSNIIKWVNPMEALDTVMDMDNLVRVCRVDLDISR